MDFLIPWVYLMEPLKEGLIKKLNEVQRHHLIRVLRLQKGDPVIVCNGRGKAWRGQLTFASPREAAVCLEGSLTVVTEPSLKVYLAQSLLKSDKMDFVIQKAVEIGVAGIVPFISSRTIKRWHTDQQHKKMDRWKVVIESAAAQSHRSFLPELFKPVQLEELTGMFADVKARFVCWEKEEENTFKKALLETHTGDNNLSKAVIAVGPEGGYSEEEIIYFKSRGWRTVGLGPRILRAETASLVALSITLFQHGDLG